jgi:LysM repeat protein
MKKSTFTVVILFCAVTISFTGCDSRKKKMLVPPSEPPAPMIVPSSINIPIAKKMEENVVPDASPILASDATDVTIENESSAQQPVSSPVSGKELFHLCRSGDTIKSVSKQHNININQLMKFNKLAPNQSLIPGKKLLLPRDLSNPASENEITTYTVVKGDSYSRIARKFHISPAALMRLNNAKDSRLDIGDVLYVPK